MNLPFTILNSPSSNPLGCHAMLTRLVGNLRGFAYRRRHDSRWTMDFISDGCRNITGYDPHRFMANASIAFSDLITPPDRRRVNERIRLAVLHRRRVMVNYLLQTAHGALVPVEDRLMPIFNSAGKLLAIEGVVDQVRSSHAASEALLPETAEARKAETCGIRMASRRSPQWPGVQANVILNS